MQARWWFWGALGAVVVACGGDDDPGQPAHGPRGGSAGKGGSAAGMSGDGPEGAASGHGGEAGDRGTGGAAGQAAASGQGGSLGHGGEAGSAATEAGGAGSDAGGSAGSSAGSAGAVEPPSYPEHLSDTGLYADLETETLAEGVREYHPAFELWSDGATKRRWVKLPAGAVIDTSDLDFWQYPLGTQLFKEFSLAGTRLETRMLHKQPGGWAMVAYLWNEDQTEALAVPSGERNAQGTTHDVPSSAACATCHGKMPDRVLGFSALQLSHDEGGVTLASLGQEGALSDPPEHDLTLPGDATARAALGYLHANCGLCHNEHSFVSAAVDVQFWLTAASLSSVEQTPTYLTTVDREPLLGLPGADALVAPGEPQASAVVLRMQLRGDEDQMPPLGTDEPDMAGIDAVSAWIEKL